MGLPLHGILLALSERQETMQMTKKTTRLQAAVLSFALLLPAGSTFATTHHHRYTRHHRQQHHYSQTRGAVVGAVAGAAIDHHKPLQGALIGAVVGDAVQAVRNKKHHG
jgi:hypothetical protein